MPENAIWSLITGLVLLALGLTYKWVENSHGLKLSEKETDRLRTTLDTLEETRKNEALGFRTEINTLKETHNKEITDIKELHQRIMEEKHLKMTNLEAEISGFQKEKDREITALNEKYRTQISQLQERNSSEKAKTAWKAST
ncbi:MAG: hypothetical protein U1D97_02620 [Desulfuromonadales bacterium]|nr:hypothetical protein [Desulfuromonadales bacterium]